LLPRLLLPHWLLLFHGLLLLHRRGLPGLLLPRRGRPWLFPLPPPRWQLWLFLLLSSR